MRDAIDDLIGFELPDGIKANPRALRRIVNGLALQGVLGGPLWSKGAVPSGLEPYMTLPPAEARTRTRARMAELICQRVAADGNVTRQDLEAAGFDETEIRELFPEARRIAGVDRMAA